MEFFKILDYTLQRINDPDPFEEILYDCFSKIGDLLDVEQVIGISNRKGDNILAHWSDNVSAVDKKIDLVDLSTLSPLLLKKLNFGIVISDNESEHIDSSNDVEILKNLVPIENLCSLMMSPIIVDKNIWGYIIILQTKFQRIWSDKEYQMLKSLSTVFANRIFSFKKEKTIRAKKIAKDNDTISYNFINNLAKTSKIDDFFNIICHYIKDFSLADGVFLYCNSSTDYNLRAQINSTKAYDPVKYFPSTQLDVFDNYWNKVIDLDVANTLEIFPIVDGVDAQYIPLKLIGIDREIFIILAWNEVINSNVKDVVNQINRIFNICLDLVARFFPLDTDEGKYSSSQRHQMISEAFMMKNKYTLWTFNMKTMTLRAKYENNGIIIPFTKKLTQLDFQNFAEAESNIWMLLYNMLYNSKQDWNVFEGLQHYKNGRDDLIRVTSLIVERDEFGFPSEIVGANQSIDVGNPDNNKEDYYQQVFTNVLPMALMGKWTYDVKKRIFYWSSELKQLLDIDINYCSYEEGLTILASSETKSEISSAFFKAFAGLSELNFYSEKTVNSKKRYYHLKAESLSNNKGEIYLLNGFVQNVTNFKELEKRAKQSESELFNHITMLKNLLNMAPFGMQVKNVIGYNPGEYPYYMCNITAAEMFQHETNNYIIGKTDKDLLSHDELVESVISDAKIISSRSKSNVEIKEIINVYGEKRRIEKLKIPVIDSDGEVASIAILLLDITNFYQEQLEQNANQNFSMISAIASNIGAEFKDIIHRAAGYGEILDEKLEELPNSTKVDSIYQIKDLLLGCNLDLEVIANRLLDFDFNEDNFKLKKINFKEFLKKSPRKELFNLGRNIEVALLSCKELIEIEADENLLDIIASDLINNMVRTIDNSAKIEVSLSTKNLGGISRIFPLFKNEKYACVSFDIKGVGIFGKNISNILKQGLYVYNIDSLSLIEAYAFVRKHKGDFRYVEENSDGNALFEIYFPLFNEKTSDKTSKKISNSPKEYVLESNDNEINTILYAESQEKIRNITKNAIRKVGYDVLVAKDGDEVLKLFEENAGIIDVVVLDVSMPILGANEIYERLHSVDSHLPIIFTTGFSKQRLEKDFMINIDLDKVLYKPFSYKELLSLIRSCINDNNKRN